jgi:prophage regulatory protein
MNYRPQKVIRQADLHLYVGLRRTQVAELIKEGQFPRPIKLSDTGRGKAWLESEILEWQERRIAQRKGA